MTVWYKQGVVGDLQPVTRKGLGRLANLLNSIGEDLHITSLREGNHSNGSLHYEGLAFDIGRFTPSDRLPMKMIKQVMGSNWDVIDEGHHIHFEYDPDR